VSKRSPKDVARALIEATRLTLRGESRAAEPGLQRHPLTLAWIQEAGTALDALEAVARAEGLDTAAFTMHIEGRDVTVQLILAGIRFHLGEEYPSLLASPSQYALLAIKATNLNDRYQVMRLEQNEALPDPVRASLRALAETLSRQPTENP
jgi:hypothetical protein